LKLILNSNEVKIHSVSFATDTSNNNFLILDLELVSGDHKHYIVRYFADPAFPALKWKVFFESNTNRKLFSFYIPPSSCIGTPGRIDITWLVAMPELIMDSMETNACATVDSKIEEIKVDLTASNKGVVSFSFNQDSDSFLPNAVLIGDRTVRHCVTCGQGFCRHLDVEYEDAGGSQVDGKMEIRIPGPFGGYLTYEANSQSTPDVDGNGIVTFVCGKEGDMEEGDFRVKLKDNGGWTDWTDWEDWPEPQQC